MKNSQRRPLVVGNWKMHGTLVSAGDLLNALRTSLQQNTAVDVAVCAPFVHLPLCRELLTISGIRWGCVKSGQQGLGMKVSGRKLRVTGYIEFTSQHFGFLPGEGRHRGCSSVWVSMDCE